MKKCRILFILPGFYFGGTVFSTLNMILCLRDKYRIAVFPMQPYGPVREQYEEAGITIMEGIPAVMAVSSMPTSCENGSFARFRIVVLKLFYHLCLALNIDFASKVFRRQAVILQKKYSPDYVCSCSEGISTEFASFFDGPKRVAWFRTEYSVWKKQLTQRDLECHQKLYRRFDYIIPVSKTTAEDFSKHFPDIAGRVIPIHNIQKDDSMAERADEPVPDVFSEDTFNIVSVGRISRQKQFHKIPAIAYRLHNGFGLPIRWCIVGGEGTGAFGEPEKLAVELDRYDNRDYVICVGDKQNPYPYIKSADLLVNTSYYEACPRAVAEARILHTPVVCSDFSSAREFVRNGWNGFVGTLEELPEIIARMASDKDLYRKIKANCDSYRMNNEHILNQLESLFS